MAAFQGKSVIECCFYCDDVDIQNDSNRCFKGTESENELYLLAVTAIRSNVN